MNELVLQTPGRELPTAAQYLSFQLGKEAFAIGILAIREIIEFDGVTAVPMMPAAIRGVINLRGAMVPVLDLSLRFDRAETAITRRTCIVVVEQPGETGAQVVGIVVDAVSAVQDIAAADIEPPPTLGLRIAHRFVSGIAKVQGRFILLLDLEQVLDVGDLAALADRTPTPGTP